MSKLWSKRYRQRDGEYIEFEILVKMKARWVPHFLAMLRQMQYYGALGCSRMLAFYSDGDGDFRPRFHWDHDLPSDGEPIKDSGGDKIYDAG